MKDEKVPAVMLDLETLGHVPGSVIVAVGAVKFYGDQIVDRFYRRVDAESCVRAGLTMDTATVLWWMKQSEAAREELNRPADSLRNVLESFAVWIDRGAEVWGNGAAFDNTLLAAAYDALGIERPWTPWKDRCYRTVKNLCRSVEMVRTGTHHNALDDAESQARHLMQMLCLSTLNPLNSHPSK